MERLAKIGFNQIYTYFTWRQSAWELRTYFEELATRTVDYMRPNVWPNTPDILTEQLQTGGRAMFAIRAILAATLSPAWGVYGPAFELMRAPPDAPGLRGVPRLREVPAAPVGPRTAPTAWPRCSVGSTASAASSRRSPTCARCASTTPRNDALLCYSKTDPAGAGPPSSSSSTSTPATARRASSTSTSPPLGLPYELDYDVVDQLHRRAASAGTGRGTTSTSTRRLPRPHLPSGDPVTHRHPPSEPSGAGTAREPRQRAARSSPSRPDSMGRRTGTATPSSTRLHVRAFADSNGDGIGDFNGLAHRLDYLADLGITAIWLLPFYPSPLRDDGYDIADYRTVHRDYGDLRQFRALPRRRPRPQHPGDHRARRQPHVRPAPVVPAAPATRPPGSTERDFYVWSDHARPLRRRPHHLPGLRDVELDVGPASPSSTSGTASTRHQPDLNYDNPDVEAGVIDVARLLARHGRRRAAPRRRAVPVRARGHELREPPRDP